MRFDDVSANQFGDDFYRRISALIYDRTGLSFNESSRFFLEKRLETRISSLGMTMPEDYLSFLMFDGDSEREWDALITLITTNETYFMREERQLKCFREDILPELARKNPGKKIRVWSAGCSSGEEPYSIAILARECRHVTDQMIEIFATDINSRVIQRAKDGIYGDSSFRAVDEAFKLRWFVPEGQQKWKLKEEIRKKVTFQRFNLFDMDRYSIFAPFDVIFCRNVIIYFDLEAKVRVVERFYDKLAEGGYLLLGHSESLISVTEKFRLVHLANDLVYRKEIR